MITTNVIDKINSINKFQIFDPNVIPFTDCWTSTEVIWYDDFNQMMIALGYQQNDIRWELVIEYQNQIRQGYLIPYCVINTLTNSYQNIESAIAAILQLHKPVPVIHISRIIISDLRDNLKLCRNFDLPYNFEINYDKDQLVDINNGNVIIDFKMIDPFTYKYNDAKIDIERYISDCIINLSESSSNSIPNAYSTFLTCLNGICNQVVQTGVHKNYDWLNDQQCYIDKDNRTSFIFKPIQVDQTNTKLDVYLSGEILICESNLNISDVETISKAIINSISPNDWGISIQNALADGYHDFVDNHDWFDYFEQILKSSLKVQTLTQPKINSNTEKFTNNRIMTIKVGNVSLQIIEENKIYKFVMIYDICFLGRLVINDKNIDKLKKDFIKLVSQSSTSLQFKQLFNWITTINKSREI